jgi:hypothetical protein
MIITKNSLTELNVFFYRKDFKNVLRPFISYIKIDNSANIQPAYHIGFKENMGYLTSLTTTGGSMVFEVLEGYPLQSLLFADNALGGKMKYKLEDLTPMDFYCMNAQNEDPYGDFILTNLKFISSRMEQGVNSPGRVLVADFVCTSMIPFKIPYFYNKFKSDNYDYHIIRKKSEIDEIKLDITQMLDTGYLMDTTIERMIGILGGKDGETMIEVLERVYNEFCDSVDDRKPNTRLLINIQLFIKDFYFVKNTYELKTVGVSTKLDFLNFLKTTNEVQ